jgi:hypothetical protein
MQGFQNLKNNPHHWSIDADKGVPFSAHNCSSLMLKNMLVGQSKRNLDNLSANSTTVIRRAPYWVKYTEQPCPQMHAEKTQDNGRNQSCNFLWPFQCQIHLTEISCFHNSLATCLFVTEEILCIIECKRTMAHYCTTHLCRWRWIQD